MKKLIDEEIMYIPEDHTEKYYGLSSQVDPKILDGLNDLEKKIVVGISNSEHDGFPYSVRVDVDYGESSFTEDQFTSILYDALKDIKPGLKNNLGIGENISYALFRGFSLDDIDNERGSEENGIIYQEFVFLGYRTLENLLPKGILSGTRIEPHMEENILYSQPIISISLKYINIENTYPEQKSVDLDTQHSDLETRVKFWKDGQIREEYTENSDGLKHGLYQSWHKNGQKRIEVNYVNGLKHGLFQWWFKDGNKQSEINYVNGQEDGLYQSWHSNGQEEYVTNYVNGLKHGLSQRWDRDGRLRYERDFTYSKWGNVKRW